VCPDENVLGAYVARALDARAREHVECHLDTCAACLLATSEFARSDESTFPEGIAGKPKEHEPAAGACIGRYRLLRYVGQGAMGRVYAAQDTQLDRRVALKLLRVDSRGLDDAHARMLREARAMAQLSHPNVVTVYDAGDADGRTFIAMEFVEGRTLAAWLAERKRPWQRTLDVLLAAGRGLSAAHAAGIVHRDFKPENVLIDSDERVAVVDFGLAATHRDHSPPSGPTGLDADAFSRSEVSTVSGTVLGTPRYMSPEQQKGLKVDARTDQFSFALVAHEALFGTLPVGDCRAPETPDADGPPPALYRAMCKGLSNDPMERYGTLEELLRALQDALAPRAPRFRAPLAATAATIFVGAAALFGARVLQRPTVVTVAPAAASASAAEMPRPGGRWTALILPLDNRAAEPLLDGTFERIVDRTLYPSHLIDSALGFTLRGLAREIDPAADTLTDGVLKGLTARPSAVAVVRSRSSREGGKLVLDLDAFRGLSTLPFFHAQERVRTPDEVVGAGVRLGSALRAALGDPAPAAEGGSLASEPLEVVHEWAIAQQLRLQEETEDALNHANRAVAAAPDFADAHVELARCFLSQHQTPEAAQQYALALRNESQLSEHERLLVLGESYDAQDEHVQAIALFERALAHWPYDLEVERRIVTNATAAGDFRLALELADRAASERPSVRTRTSLVAACLNNNQLERAAAEGEAALAAYDRPVAYLFIDTAVAEALMGQVGRAQAILTRMSSVDDEFADEGMADLALFEGRLADAEALLRRWTDAAEAKGDPGLARSEYLTLAELLLRRGDRAGAGRAATQALQGSEEEDALGHQYEILRALVDAGLAAKVLPKVDEWAKSGSSDRRMYARILEGDLARVAGRLDEAVSAYREAARVRDTWMIHAQLGAAYLLRKEWEEADQELSICWARRGEAALVSAPALHFLPSIVLGLARARDGQGRADASETYRQLVAIEPSPQNDPYATMARERLAALSGPPQAKR
jgi:serine/threonine-protein kinase